MKQLAFVAFSLLLFTACDDFENTASPSGTTFLPKMELQGNSAVNVPCGESYTDAGIEVTEGGSPIDFDVDITGSYFGNTEVTGSDVYQIAYSALNKDGIPGSAFRDVVVAECTGDFNSSIAGMYTASVSRYGGLSAQQASDLGPFIVKDLGDNKYQISDAIGGYYDLNVGYGWHYAATGMVVTANDIPGNSFSHDEVVGVGDFGGNLIMNSFSVDAGTKTITFQTEWDAVADPTFFDVTLVQVN